MGKTQNSLAMGCVVEQGGKEEGDEVGVCLFYRRGRLVYGSSVLIGW